MLTNMLANFKKINIIKKVLVVLILSITTYISFIVFYLTYDIVQSPDFEKYYKYFLYYSGQISSTELEQGHFYYFLIYIVSFLVSGISSELSLNEQINMSVHLTNSLIYLFGIIGIYKYLITRKFEKNIVLLILVSTCFLPASIVLRITFKPELLVFSLLGWIIFYIDKFSKSSNSTDAYILIFLLSIILTAKISTTVMVVIFLSLFVIFDYKDLLKKKNLKYLFILFIISISIFIENSIHNDKYLHEVTHNENYNNRASLEFFTSVNYKDLKNNPNRYFHNDSFISITMFDTFNDFFYLYWNSEYTELNQERKRFFKVVSVQDNSPLKIRYSQDEDIYTLFGNFDDRWRDSEYIDETRMRFSFFGTILFYFLMLISGLVFKKSRVIIFSTLIGVTVVILSSAGFFGTNNFDPLVGDSAKVFYYSFFVILTYVFVLSEIFNKVKLGRKTILIFLNFIFLFFIGFPFSFSSDTVNDLNYKNSSLPLCKINEPIINNLFSVDYENLDCKKIFNEFETYYPVTVLKNNNHSFDILRVPFINILTFLAIPGIWIRKKIYG